MIIEYIVLNAWLYVIYYKQTWFYIGSKLKFLDVIWWLSAKRQVGIFSEKEKEKLPQLFCLPISLHVCLPMQ